MWELLELLFIHLIENIGSDLIMCRDEAAAELSRERALWELLELLFVQPPTAHGTAAEVSGCTTWSGVEQRVARQSCQLEPCSE